MSHKWLAMALAVSALQKPSGKLFVIIAPLVRKTALSVRQVHQHGAIRRLVELGLKVKREKA